MPSTIIISCSARLVAALGWSADCFSKLLDERGQAPVLRRDDRELLRISECCRPITCHALERDKRLQNLAIAGVVLQ
jgi:hypothetical protein